MKGSHHHITTSKEKAWISNNNNNNSISTTTTLTIFGRWWYGITKSSPLGWEFDFLELGPRQWSSFFLSIFPRYPPRLFFGVDKLLLPNSTSTQHYLVKGQNNMDHYDTTTDIQDKKMIGRCSSCSIHLSLFTVRLTDPLACTHTQAILVSSPPPGHSPGSSQRK